MVRQLGTEAFLEQVEKSQPLSEFLFEQLSDGIDSSTADGKARLSKTCAPQINRIPQGVFRQLMLEELSRRTGISADNLSLPMSLPSREPRSPMIPITKQAHKPNPLINTIMPPPTIITIPSKIALWKPTIMLICAQPGLPKFAFLQ